MNQVNGEYLGIRFTTEVSVSDGGDFVGHYVLLDAMPLGDGAASIPPIEGVGDVLHPSLGLTWATENEAISDATQAAHHAIEILVAGRTQGQGNRSAATDRRTGGT